MSAIAATDNAAADSRRPGFHTSIHCGRSDDGVVDELAGQSARADVTWRVQST